MKKRKKYFNGEPEADVHKRYLSLVKGWEREQKEGPSYWLSSEQKSQTAYQRRKEQEKKNGTR